MPPRPRLYRNLIILSVALACRSFASAANVVNLSDCFICANECKKRFDCIVDVTEDSRLSAISINAYRFILKSRSNKARNNHSVMR